MFISSPHQKRLATHEHGSVPVDVADEAVLVTGDGEIAVASAAKF